MGQTLTVSCGNILGQQLVSAIREGEIDRLQRVFDSHPKRVNVRLLYDRQTPLHIAASYGQLEVLVMLLERGAKPNALNRHGQTPLMLACKTGQWTCLDPLLNAGASILAFDYIGRRSCLHYACRGGHTECVRQLLDFAQRGPVALSWGLARFVNLRDCRGFTGLHIAAKLGHAHVLRLLLKSGAVVNCVSVTMGNDAYFATSPIHIAAREGSLECVRELLAWGANRCSEDRNRNTPFGIATKYRNTACAAVLDPEAAEPLVWPSPWKFMSDGELEAEAKMVLEAALAEAHEEFDKEIAVQEASKAQEQAQKSITRRKGGLSLGTILGSPERRVRSPLIADVSVETDTAMPMDKTSAEEARLSAVGDVPSEAPREKARISVVGDLPGGDLSRPDSTAVDTGDGQEVCCICFEHFCTIEVVECGHQMCATCTLSLCCAYRKPNPAFPYTQTPCCPFCRNSIGHLTLARGKSKQAEMKEKFKRKLRRSQSKNSRRHSRGESGGKGSLTGSILNLALGGSKRLGASARVVDAGLPDRSSSKRLGASSRLADCERLDRSGSKRVGASGRVIEGTELLDRCGASKRIGASCRVTDAEGHDRFCSKRMGASGRVVDAIELFDRCGSKRIGASGRFIADPEWLDRFGSRRDEFSGRIIADATDPLYRV